MNSGAWLSTTPLYGAASTLAYNYTATIGNEWSSTTAAKNVSLNANIGTIYLNENKKIDGTLTINIGDTLDATLSNYKITFGNGAAIINNGKFFTQNDTITFNGAASISGSDTVSFYYLVLKGNINGLFSIKNNGTISADSALSITGNVNFLNIATLRGDSTVSFSSLDLHGATNFISTPKITGTLSLSTGSSIASGTVNYGPTSYSCLL